MILSPYISITKVKDFTATFSNRRKNKRLHQMMESFSCAKNLNKQQDIVYVLTNIKLLVKLYTNKRHNTVTASHALQKERIND